MGFNSVYQSLKELFPQVDTRLLKAVSIEHSKDPDRAVEIVLTDVLPFTSVKSNAATTIVANDGKLAEVPSSSILESVAGKDANDSHLLNDAHAHNIDDDSLASDFYDANDTDELQNGNTGSEASQTDKLVLASGSLIDGCSKDDFFQAFEKAPRESQDNKTIFQAFEEYVASSRETEDNRVFVQAFEDCEAPRDSQDNRTGVHVDEASSSTVNTDYPEADVSLNNCQDASPDCVKDALGFDYHQEQQSLDCDVLGYRISVEEQQSLDCDVLGYRISVDQASVSVKEPEAENGLSFSDGGNKEMNGYVNADFTQDFPETDVGAEGETALSTIVTNSGQICRINLVEEIIEDAKNYKDVLLSAAESILRLIEEVEHQEKEAEHAKAAAARGGLDILEKVEEIKAMLKHAKEANEMHAGEVYGEKSILATEVRELQTRLFGLADEKDKSLAILDEMRESLEARLAASEEERKVAEKVMLEKQEFARGALAEQELIMEKVVQESKLLQQEAEENAKLRDFLMEKGRVVDELHGEISVICQDVKSLKEKFDKRAYLSKSLSIEQTSFRMASSTSSVKSMASDPATGHMEFPETPKTMSQTPSVECQTPRSNVGEEAAGAESTPQKELRFILVNHPSNVWEESESTPQEELRSLFINHPLIRLIQFFNKVG